MSNDYKKVKGTTETSFQVGKSGPIVKNSSGVVELRNSADNAYAVTRGATPVATNDLTTKGYVDAISIVVSFDGQGFALVSGSYIDIPVKYAGTITGWVMANTARVGGTDQVSVDLRKCTTAQYTSNPYPTSSIVASAPITFSSAGDYTRTVTDVSTWTTSLAAGDWLRFYISSATAITNITIQLNITRT